ncbi:MAG: substrate-binding domain-containing protein [Phycisphaerae bacterium]|nr:substrate-binding domain-containing protein [Phycisphaerae bacterium]
MMRGTLFVFTVMILCASLHGCKDNSPPAAGNQLLTIAVIPKATNHEFWKSIHAGAVKAEQDLDGIKIVWKGPAREDDREQQINVVDNFANAKVDGIVLAPLDDVALVRPVREATAAGVPVVIMDSGLKAAAGEDYVSFVATDNVAGGRKAAQCLGAVLGGKGKVLVMRYQVGSDSTTNREDGFVGAMASEFPEIEIVSSDQYGGATTESCHMKAESLLTRFGGELDGVFCACEPAAFGMLLALRDAGLAGRVKLVTFDPSEKLIEAMAAGEVHGIVLQDPLTMGYLAVKTLVSHIRGESVADRIDTGSEVATPDNMTEPRIAELLRPPIDKYLK